MSYVPTSDNKYIQARCTANEFTTDITKWQIQGAEVTVSQNSQTGHIDINIGSDSYPVPSLGDINTLSKQTTEEDINLTELEPISLAVSSGKWINYQQASYRFVPVNDAKRVKLVYSVTGQISFLKQRPTLLFQNDKTVLFADDTQEIEVNGTQIIDIPEDANYIGILSTNVSGQSLLPLQCLLQYERIANSNNQLSDKVNGIAIDVNKNNVEYAIVSGVWSTTNGYGSLVIPCVAGHKYRFRGNSLNYGFIQILKTQPVQGESVEFSSQLESVIIPQNAEISFIAPDDAAYFVLSGYIRDTNSDRIPISVIDETSTGTKTDNIINLSDIDDYDFVIDETWKQYSGFSSKVIKLKGKTIKIVADTSSCAYAFLKEKYVTKQDTSVKYADGTGFYNATIGQLTELEVPSDAEYFYLYVPTGKTATLITEILSENPNEIATDILGDNAVAVNGNFIYAYGYDSITVDILPGRQYLVRANNNADVYASWLKERPVVNSPLVFAIGATENSIHVPKGNEMIFFAPDDALFLNINTISNDVTGKRRTPQLVEILSTPLGMQHPNNVLYVAASDSSDRDKSCADYVCSGTRDNEIIQTCIDILSQGLFNGKGGEIILFAGHYDIGSFPKKQTAIGLPMGNTHYGDINKNTTNITIKGFIHNVDNVIFELSGDLYEQLDSNVEWTIFGEQEYGALSYNHHSLQNIHVHIPSATKKIVCIDGTKFASLELVNVICDVEDRGGYNEVSSYIPNYDCIGVRGTAGNNNQRSYEWKNVECFGFGQGFAVGGEHLLMIKCGACFCRYGYTFNSYSDSANVSNHPITIIDCSDEANMNLPKLCTLYDYSTGNPRGAMSQGLYFINFNLELHNDWLAMEGNLIIEETPGQYCGFMNYTTWGSVQIFGANSGLNIRVTNDQYKQKGTTQERLSATAPQMAQFYDVTLNKMCYLIDRDNQTWVDALGNNVDE